MFKKETARVNEELRGCVDKLMPEKLRKASLHLLVGGKRTRPTLLFLSAKTVSRDMVMHRAIPAATALELIHTASIIHDDIIDKSLVRRGVESVHVKYGVDTALLVGDLLLSKAHYLIDGHMDTKVTEAIDVACTKLCEGEMLELEMSFEDIDEETYLRIVERKTAALAEASTKIGAILAGGSDLEVERMASVGRNFGMAFQIVDDLLDVVGDPEALGKPTDTDRRMGRHTIVTIKSVGYAMKLACHYTNEAKLLLLKFPDSYGRKGMWNLLDFNMQREE